MDDSSPIREAGMWQISKWIREIWECKDAEKPADPNPPENEKSQELSPQGLAVHKMLYDHVDYLKKQQWTVTNSVGIVYGAIFALAARDLSLWQKGLLMLAVGGAAVYGIYLLRTIQCHLGGARIRVDKADLEVFGKLEYQSLGMKVEQSPYTRGLEFTRAMIAVLFVGAVVLILYLAFNTK
jgi:hypothetical protein